MAVTYLGAGTRPTPVASGNITVKLPTHAANDILVVLAVSRDGVASTLSGWETKVSLKSGEVMRYNLFWLRATEAGPAEVTVTHTGGNVMIARGFAFRGVITTGDPWETAGPKEFGTATPQVMTPPGVGVNSENTMGFAGFAVADDGVGAAENNYAVTGSEGLTWTEVEDFETETGLDVSMGAYVAPKPTTGIQTVQVTTTPSASAIAIAWLGFLVPEPAQPGVGCSTMMGIGR